MKKLLGEMVDCGVVGVLLRRRAGQLIWLGVLFTALMLCGCRVVEVENRGEGVLVGADGAPVLVDGKLVRYSKGWNVYHNQHWMATEADTLEASIRSNEISFALGKLNTKPSEELAKLVDVSLKGATELLRGEGGDYEVRGEVHWQGRRRLKGNRHLQRQGLHDLRRHRRGGLRRLRSPGLG